MCLFSRQSVRSSRRLAASWDSLLTVPVSNLNHTLHDHRIASQVVTADPTQLHELLEAPALDVAIVAGLLEGLQAGFGEHDLREVVTEGVVGLVNLRAEGTARLGTVKGHDRPQEDQGYSNDKGRNKQRAHICVISRITLQ